MTLDNEDKLLEYIEQFVKSGKPSHKGKITRLINRMYREDGAKDKVIFAFDFLGLVHFGNRNFQLLKKKYLRSAPHYQNRSQVFGWYSENQKVAEQLPVLLAKRSLELEGIVTRRDYNTLEVDFYGHKNKKKEWKEIGFDESIPTAFDIFEALDYENAGELGKFTTYTKLEVHANFTDNCDRDWLLENSDYSIAAPVTLPYNFDDGHLKVDRNRRELGFWKAYKYFNNCKDWYENKLEHYFFDWQLIPKEILEFVLIRVAELGSIRREPDYVCITPLDPLFARNAVFELILYDWLLVRGEQYNIIKVNPDYINLN